MSGKAYSLVGGGRDGAELEIEGSVPTGAELRLVLPHDASRCEVYVLGEDGRFRFDRHALRESATVGPDRETLRPIIARLGAALIELEAAYTDRGITPPPIQVNAWLVQRVGGAADRTICPPPIR